MKIKKVGFFSALISVITIIFGGVILFTGHSFASGQDAVAEEDIKVHFFNVNSIEHTDANGNKGPIGSADFIVIEDNGKVMIIDAGREWEESLDKVGKSLDALGITKVDHLFMTHSHNDHGGGMPYVIDKCDVVNAYMKPADWDVVYSHELGKEGSWGSRSVYDNAYLAAARKLNSDGSTVNIVIPDREGMKIQVTESSYFEIFNCVIPWENHHYHPEFNDFSMVVKYTYVGKGGEFSMLLLADVNIHYESSYRGKVGRCQLIKMAHHGAFGLVPTDELFDEIQAEVALITGIRANFPNRYYDIPTVDTVLDARLIPYYITEDGDVHVKTDGGTILVTQDTGVEL